MSRPRRYSVVQIPPRVKGFVPVGYYSDKTDPIILNVEEFEVIRLLDYENLSQENAAEIMEISRPTLTRIYSRARKKLAQAITESRQIKIEGGKAIFSSSWYECKTCFSSFNNTQSATVEVCPLCNSKLIVNYGENNQE